MMFRSTKGASKQRRDLINTEIVQIRDLLPLPESARQRLSQLQIMSLACCYIRKNSYFSKLFGSPKSNSQVGFEFSQAMSGFLLITNKEGKLLYISENVTEFLGHSMVDMLTQGDSVYDIIDKRDHGNVQAQLQQVTLGGAPSDEKTFFCRMNVSRSLRRQGGYGEHKVMYCHGHYAQSLEHYGSQPVFVATVTPLVTPDVKESVLQNNTMIYQTVHGLDMKFSELATNGEFHLGHAEEEVKGRSWYEYIHPEDLSEAREKHAQLIKSSHEMGCMLTVRMLTKSFDWQWTNIVMYIRQPFVCDDADPNIVCINQVIDQSEAQHFKMQSQLYSSHIARSPEFLTTSQESSPPHTITQVPMETDPYGASSQGYSSTPVYYPSSEFGGVATPTYQTMSRSPVTTTDVRSTTSSSMSVSESSSDSQGGDWERAAKQVVASRLKRKIESAAQNQPCKPSKKVRYTSEGSNGSANMSDVMGYFSTTTTLGSVQGGLNFPAATRGGGELNMMMQVAETPVYAQLKTSVDLKVKNPDVLMLAAGAPHSPGPLTPESITSEGGGSGTPQQTMISGGLTVDVSEAALVPASMLTPDASPMNSPVHVSHGSPEQCVPSIIEDLEEALRREEFEPMHVPPPPLKEKQVKLSPGSNLPELDALCIDSFFGTLESLSKSISMPVQKDLPSPLSVPISVKQEVIEELEFTDDMKALLADGEIATHMASVADLILNMAQNSEGMVVAALPEVKLEEDMATVPVQIGAAQGLTISPDDLISELHQLNALAASSKPSYGEEDFATAIFKQTL